LKEEGVGGNIAPSSSLKLPEELPSIEEMLKKISGVFSSTMETKMTSSRKFVWEADNKTLNTRQADCGTALKPI
jgi:hypothetical protein